MEEVDERGINEEAKSNFKFGSEVNYKKPDFDSMKRGGGGSYPKFNKDGDDDDNYDPDLKEYYNTKTIKKQGEDLI